jgi:putative N-acetyltransferase (TIGR04045 family)
MLHTTRVWDSPVIPFISPVRTARVAAARWELAACARLRQRVFVDEYGLFPSHDRDAHDAYATPIVCVSSYLGFDDEVVGVVRIYPTSERGSCVSDGRAFFGGRLAVDQRYRRHGGVGGALIRTAVGTAKGRGCDEFFATVQRQNVRYFRTHGFEVLRAVQVCDRPHALMAARLELFDALNAGAQVLT